MDVGSWVSRRTRSSEAAYFRNIHATIKKPDRQDNNTDVGRTMKNTETIQELESGDDDSDVEEKKKRRKSTLKKKGARTVWRPRKKKKGRGMGEMDFGRLLEEGVGWKGKDLAIESGVDVRESALPLKFELKLEEEGEKEKSEFEMEIEGLFDDLEMGLWETETAADCCVSRSDDDDVEEHPAGRCSRGEHDHILDEEIGVICRFCRAVSLDIKYVLPPFAKVDSPRLEKMKNHDIFEFTSSTSTSSSEININSIPCLSVVDLIPSSDKSELYPHQLEGLELMWRNVADGGQGCIISHAPGTGKTRLTIVFLQTFMRLHPGSRPVIIAPRGMLLTWEQELRKWNSGLHFHNLNDSKLSDQESAVGRELYGQGAGYSRFVKVLCWMKGGSILGVGYRLFEELTLGGCSWFKKTLLESPTLLVLDEGHTPRNHNTLLWEAVSQVATPRRIILSGTPFQNNFDELHNTLSLVNPTLAKSLPRNNSPTDRQIKILRSLIQPFVHIHKATITLPGITHCLIILNPTHLQDKLLALAHSSNLSHFKQHHLASLISLHPSLVSEEEDFRNHRSKLTSLQLDPTAGVKTHFLIKLIHLSSRLHEKVLIFSEFLKPLHHLQNLLKSHFQWIAGREVMYIDGDLSMEKRQRLITSFNDSNNREAKVMLASQRACCEGISLVGASRVIFIDVSWNPSVQKQAMCRAYRLGQQKMVFVYHLVTSMELSKYAVQAEKDRISDLIFSPAIDNHSNEAGVGEQDEVLEAMLDHQTMIQRIVRHPKESDFIKGISRF